jgi:predicted short-subunit dehydrogenase-like oxidoreductase (DUF2520 family)
MTNEIRTEALGTPERTARALPASVAVVGAGRLGSALASALRSAGIDASGPFGRGAPPAADAVVLCVPDGEIAAAAGAAAGAARYVGHTSGASGLSALEPAGAQAFGIHPLQTFAGGEPPERFRGAGCAVAGSTPSALQLAEGLAVRLGMRPFAIEDHQRAAYHAAASIASNFLVTLQASAEEAAAAAGIAPDDARALLAPLVRATVENWAALGPERALTGPLARGDDATVERQRESLAVSAPHLLPLFDELAERTRALAGRLAAT